MRTFSIGNFGHHVELPVASCLEAISVEGDAVVFLGFEAEDLGSDVLDGVEEFAVAGQQQRSIGPAQFDGDFGGCIGGGG